MSKKAKPSRVLQAPAPRAGAGDAAMLDLDALFGRKKRLTVKWQDREYTLRHLDELSPRDLMELTAMQKQIATLQKQLAAPQRQDARKTDKQLGVIEDITGALLALLCPELAGPGMSFAVKSRVLTWYFEQVSPAGVSADSEKKVPSPA